MRVMQTEEVMEIFVDYLIGERKSNDIPDLFFSVN
jgi:hypothetical protein